MSQPSGFMNTLNAQQAESLKQLKDKVKAVDYLIDHPDGDAYLLRFLRATMNDKKGARVFNVDAAYQRIMKTVEWIKETKVDEEPAKWKEFTEIKPISVWIDSKLQVVVTSERVGKFFSHTKPEALADHEWEHCAGHFVYKLDEQIREYRRANNMDDSPRLIAIQDLSGLGSSAFKMRKIFKQNNRIAGTHFPELVKRAYLVNPPWIFDKIFSLAKKFIDPDTLDKVRFLKGIEGLADEFDVSTLPRNLGGKAASLRIPRYAKDMADPAEKEEDVVIDEKLLME